MESLKRDVWLSQRTFIFSLDTPTLTLRVTISVCIIYQRHLYESQNQAFISTNLRMIFWLIFISLPKALLKLSIPVGLSSDIQTMKLPSDCGTNIFDDVLATMIGAGLTESRTTDGLLREASLLTVSSTDRCPEDTMADHRSVICTVNAGTRTSPYFGDSGTYNCILKSDIIINAVFGSANQ